MNVNLFQWIRDGVKHSVMAGVADAVEQIGVPPTDDNLSARLGEYLRSPAALPAARGSAPIARKRLGRSLKDLAPAQTPENG